MTLLEEFDAALVQFEDAVEKLALLALTLRRLERQLQAEQRKPDFNFMTGGRPE